jgi:hypothetical protein
MRLPNANFLTSTGEIKTGWRKRMSAADPRKFCALVGKILPTQVTGDDEARPLRIDFSWVPPQSGGSQSPCMGPMSM